MGLLTDLLISRISPSYYNNMAQDERLRKQQEAMNAAMAQEGLTNAQVQGPPTASGQRPGGLLDTNALLRLAAASGNEGLLNQVGANVGAGERNTANIAGDMAKAQWLNNNISAAAQGQLDQNQPYVDAGVAQRYASAGASDASAARTLQGAGFDAQLQPGKLQGQQLTNQGLLQQQQNYRTPEQQQAMQVETAAMKAADTSRAAIQEKNATTDSWNSMVDDYTRLSTEARGGTTGLLSGTEAATLETKRTQLVYAMAKEMSGGNAEPNPAVIAQAEQLVPALGFGGRDEVFKARMAALKRKPRAVPAKSTQEGPGGGNWKKVN